MNIKHLSFVSLIAFAALLPSCNDNDTAVPTCEIQLETRAPESLGNQTFTWVEGCLTMNEINTGQETSFPLPATALTLTAGQYMARIEGRISYTGTDGKTDTLNVRGSRENITVTETNTVIRIDLVIYDIASSFVISEIYCTGSLDASGQSPILGEKFFKIYNNSDTVQYADGLALLESALTCTFAYTYTPDPRKDGFPAHTVYVIPGSGKEHPVQPGSFIVLVDQASDHSAGNPNGIDMSKADFEWYDENDKVPDTDNPEVPNMEKWYSYSLTIWTPSYSSNRAYAIARILTDKEKFMQNYYHNDWSYESLPGHIMYQKGYLVPNEWILDAVNLCPKTKFTMLATSETLDKSFVSISDNGISTELYGKSVQRRTAGELTDKDGRIRRVLLDTNDSSNDFTVETVSYKKE